jgi:dCTP diphosphatase
VLALISSARATTELRNRNIQFSLRVGTKSVGPQASSLPVAIDIGAAAGRMKIDEDPGWLWLGRRVGSLIRPRRGTHERTAPRMDLNRLATRLQAFAQERDWEQFHTPKNLAIALSVEAGELLELFQWLTPTESSAVTDTPADAARIREELADVLLYLVRLADILDVDLEAAAETKLAANARKYPVELSRGNATKASRRVDS